MKNANDRENNGLEELLAHSLKDMYYVEKQLIKALPKMARAANSGELRTAFETHLAETGTQHERLEKVFRSMGMTPKGKKCPAIDGILEEGKEMMEEFADDPALDAALVAAAQKVEHYEIATYGSMCAWAQQLGFDEVKDLLGANLEEEKAADEKLSDLAEGLVNVEAEEGTATAPGGNGARKPKGKRP